MKAGWGRENREEDKGTKERKKNGKEEECICEMGSKNGKGKGGGRVRTKETQGGGKRAGKGRRAKRRKGIGNKRLCRAKKLMK